MSVHDTTTGLRLIARLLHGMGPAFPDVYVCGRDLDFSVQIGSGPPDDRRVAAVDILLSLIDGEAHFDPVDRETGTTTYGGYADLGAHVLHIYAPKVGRALVERARAEAAALRDGANSL